MVQFILEQLVNGTPLAYISPNIASQAALAMPRVKSIVQELPRINFIQKCWTILRIIGDTLAAYRIGKVDQGDQLFSDGTGRRQIDLHNFVVGFSLMINVYVPSYYQPPSSWRERCLISRLTLCYQPFWAEGSGCSGGRRCWSIHTLNTIALSQTRALLILASWVLAVL